MYFNNHNDIVLLTRERGKGDATAGYTGQVCNWESRARTADPAFPVISRRRCCFIEMNERGSSFVRTKRGFFLPFLFLWLMAQIKKNNNPCNVRYIVKSVRRSHGRKSDKIYAV